MAKPKADKPREQTDENSLKHWWWLPAVFLICVAIDACATLRVRGDIEGGAGIERAEKLQREEKAGIANCELRIAN
jgi:hypothetical protein